MAIKHYQSMTITTKVQWFTTLTASYPEVQCHTAYQIVILWYQSAHINTVLWLVRTGWNWFKLSISFHWKAYCFGDASSLIVESLAGESTCLFLNTRPMYFVSIIINTSHMLVVLGLLTYLKSLQLLNCSKNYSNRGPLYFL